MIASGPQRQTHADRIIESLRERQRGASDAELARLLGTSPQTINQACRKLANQGVLIRGREGGTIVNRVLSGESMDASASDKALPEPPSIPLYRPWFWEGNVQAKVVAFLVQDGWNIRRVVDTASRERGKDIEAERDGNTLWVTVKGFPNPTAKTHPSVQSKHWFSDALFDVISWRQESSIAQVVVALPLFPRYQVLRERTRWLEATTPFQYLWVTESGQVLSDAAAGTDLCLSQ